MRLEDFDFDLPSELIAQYPADKRGESRLLTLDGNTGAIADRRFAELPELIAPGDVLVFNDTRVVKARLRARKPSGGQVELLVERLLDERQALALLSASHPPRPNSTLAGPGGVELRVLERNADLYRIEFAQPVLQVLELHGEVPLPPYIVRPAAAQDEERYQTVYARRPGAAAAPTAGLHFDGGMLQRLAAAGVQLAFLTLHVGAGTFQPVRTARIEDHRMHSERYDIPAETVTAIERARAGGGKVVAVGTTSLRALEAAGAGGCVQPGAAETALFVTPGFRFRMVDRLITNFHLPRSTLLMLVAAFAGREHVLHAYRHAVEERYRFFSYGDAMLIARRDSARADPPGHAGA
jgi:S-adenosylmethionine:tRNA ribosyltransferase-isomerase